MESSVKSRVNSICRACLSESPTMRPLFQKMAGDNRSLFEVLSFVTNMNVTTNDRYPQQLCDTCFTLMCKTDEFKKTCMKSENILKVMFKSGKVNDNGVKIEACKSGLEPFQCTICFEKFMTCTSLESHVMLGHYCIKDSSKELENYNELTDTGVACDDGSLAINKPYEVKEESDMGATDYTDYFDVDTSYTETLDYKQEDENKTFECNACGLPFIDEKAYKVHVKDCSDTISRLPLRTKFKKAIKQSVKKNETCSKCESSFSSLKSLRRHQREVHKDNTEEIYQCTTCMRSFLRKNSFLSHMKMHESKDHLKYICNTCKREFQHQAHLDNHVLAVHTRDKGYSCEVCGVSFTTLECLNIHKETHKVEKKHQCKLCNKAFQMMSTLNEHMRTHTGERPHLCSICGRGFTQKNNLEQHVRRHKGLKPFKCETCERGFVSKGELVAHARKHSGAHPFVCDDCGKGFTTSSSLVKHRRIHTGERPYGCDLCSMRFSASGTLKNHRRTHTGEKPYQCSHCEKAFVQRQDLVSHIRCHTGERPYVCANCGQAFRKASALKTHVKIHGKDGNPTLTLSSLQDVNALLTHHVS